MKLNRTSVVLPLAALLVIGGASAAFAASGGAPSTTGTVVPAADSPSPSAATTAPLPDKPRDTVLEDALTKLVADGTITESQKTAILNGVAAERTARQAARQAEREQLRSFLAEGVITQAEIDQLPADSYLRTLTTLLDDGKITTEELQGLGRGFGYGGRGGHGFGKLFRGNGAAPGAAPAASPTTGGCRPHHHPPGTARRDPRRAVCSSPGLRRTIAFRFRLRARG